MTDKLIKSITDITNIIPIKDVGGEILILKDNNKESQMMSKIKALESQFIAGLKKQASDNFEGKIRDYEIPSVTEIEKQAAEDVEAKYDNKSKVLEKDYESTLTKLEADILGVDLDRQNKEHDFEQSKYKKEKQIYESIAKKGLNHSSIGDLFKESFDTSKAKEYGLMLEEIQQKKQKIEDQIFDAKSKYELALEGYEIAKAAELKKTISELTRDAEREAKLAEDINKRVREEESEYFENFSQLLMDKEREDREKGEYDGYKKSNYEKRFDVAKEYYMKLDKEEAIEKIEQNSALKDKLGIYYDRLIREIKGE